MFRWWYFASKNFKNHLAKRRLPTIFVRELHLQRQLTKMTVGSSTNKYSECYLSSKFIGVCFSSEERENQIFCLHLISIMNRLSIVGLILCCSVQWLQLDSPENAPPNYHLPKIEKRPRLQPPLPLSYARLNVASWPVWGTSSLFFLPVPQSENNSFFGTIGGKKGSDVIAVRGQFWGARILPPESRLVRLPRRAQLLAPHWSSDSQSEGRSGEHSPAARFRRLHVWFEDLCPLCPLIAHGPPNYLWYPWSFLPDAALKDEKAIELKNDLAKANSG